MRLVAAIVLAVVALAAGAWYLLTPADRGAMVRARLLAFSDVVNSSAVDGQGPDVHAAQLAAFFAEDVHVALGQGAVPIVGRDTVIGMAVRLQPRTAAFRLKFEDVSVEMAPTGETADVHLTAEFIRRSISTGEESLDAREFSIGMRRVGSEWKIARVTAVTTLK
jgi:autotransporter translocation and assembly factor TamB